MARKTSRTRLRMGIIGVGSMGSGHCGTMKRVREMKLTAVCDIDPHQAAKIGERFRVPAFISHKALIKSGLCIICE